MVTDPSSRAGDHRSVAQLLEAYAAILAELRRRRVVRTNNAPVGDYAEWLVAQAFNGELAGSTASKSYDLTLPDRRRVQVKARLVSRPPARGQLQASVFRSFDFELAAFVLLHESDYAVERAVLVPCGVVQEVATRIEHVNGWRIMMTAAVMDHPESEDITAILRKSAANA